MKQRKRKTGRGEAGSHLVEYGLLLLPLITVVLGMLEGGRYLWTYSQMQDAVRGGAAYAIANYSTISTPSDSGVTTAAKVSTVGDLTSSILVTTTKGTNVTNNNYVEVQAGYTFQPVTNLLPFKGAIVVQTRMYVP